MLDHRRPSSWGRDSPGVAVGTGAPIRGEDEGRGESEGVGSEDAGLGATSLLIRQVTRPSPQPGSSPQAHAQVDL